MGRYENLDVGRLKSTRGNGKCTKNIKAIEVGDEAYKKTILQCTGVPISIADDAGVAQYGGVKVYDFPACAMQVLGARVVGSFTFGVTGTIINTYDGVFALGTATASTGATLTSTEADIMASKSLTQAVSKVAAASGVGVAAPATVYWDGTSTAKDCYLNIAIADDATHTAGTGTFSGTIELFWINFGDI